MVPAFLFAQQRKAFKIIGHSSFYNNQQLIITGGVFPESYGYNDFEFKNEKVDTLNNPYKLVQIQQNQFTITGTQKYPHPFFFSYYDVANNRGYNSYIFFADGGTVNIKLNDLSKDKNLGNHLNSKANKEYHSLKKMYSNSVDTITDEIYNMQTKQQTMQRYIAKNPDSYVALWDMVLDYPLIINKSDKESILRNTRLFSAKIKRTTTYQALVDNIMHDFELNIGKIFPNISVSLSDSLFKIINRNKFTLIDFWFSGCAPCIEQFPYYKKIYDTYKEDHFEIIGISVDRQKDEANWQKIIQKFDLKWLQYLDTDGKETDKLFIRKFPTNFLLDSTGKILQVDISPSDLDTFLQKNLN